MNRSLVIAPQWIGDAVMSQPLMAALMARGETLSVAALPWVSPRSTARCRRWPR
jgi:heptosyltransferase II